MANRGNPHIKIYEIDCHEVAQSATSRNDKIGFCARFCDYKNLPHPKLLPQGEGLYDFTLSRKGRGFFFSLPCEVFFLIYFSPSLAM
ncbi:hypothetical protein ACWIUD_04975 [Helicobacter sp. 23-1044]